MRVNLHTEVPGEGRSGCFIRAVTVQTTPHRTAIFTQFLLLLMAVATKLVELFFDQCIHLLICLVAVEAQAIAAVVDEVVVAIHAVNLRVVGVGKAQRQHGL